MSVASPASREKVREFPGLVSGAVTERFITPVLTRSTSGPGVVTT
jgi:hypothetical protein